MFDVAAGQVYRHRKGGVYTVLAVATHTEDGTRLVVYVSADGRVWARPLAMFTEPGRFIQILEAEAKGTTG